jgi:hypothetical protein
MVFVEISSKTCKKNFLDFASKIDEYTLILNLGFEKKLANILNSLWKMKLKSSSIARSIDNFFAHFIKHLNLVYAY